MYLDTIKHAKFVDWQYTSYFTKAYGDISLHTCIEHLVKNGIVPFLIKNGYNLILNTHEFTNGIATILYYLDCNPAYIVKLPPDYFDTEFYEYYTIYGEWDIFWKAWDEDLNEFLKYTHTSNCNQLQDYIYSCINFETSPKYIEYTKENEEEEENDSETKKKYIDPYLLDTYGDRY